MTRVLFAERISFDRAQSQSLESQDIKLEERATQRRIQGETIDVVGKAVDQSVSGAIDMKERPELGKWLTPEGLQSWDELWVTTQDRLGRDDMHFMSFVFDLVNWKKGLVVLDDPSMDFTTEEGRVMAHLKSVGPAKELKRIQIRVQESHDRRRNTPRWHGGIPPYGYTTTRVQLSPNKDGKSREGRVLVLDEYMCSVLHEIRKWLVEDGETLHGAAQRLNARAEPTGKDLWREGKERGSLKTRWAGGNLKQILTAQSLLGVKLYKGKPMHNQDGSPFVIADPVFTQEEWDSLQGAIKERQITRTRANGASPLLGISYCDKCGKSALQWWTNPNRPGGGNRYYRCTNPDTKCPGVLLRADYAEELVEQTILEEIGEADVPKKVWEPGADYTEELKQLDKRIKQLRSDRESGVFDDEEGEEYYRNTMKQYTARRKELAKLPEKPSGWVYHDTGVTYRQVWGKADQQGRRKLLVDAGVKLFITNKHIWRVFVPEDIKDRVRNAS